MLCQNFSCFFGSPLLLRPDEDPSAELNDSRCYTCADTTTGSNSHSANFRNNERMPRSLGRGEEIRLPKFADLLGPLNVWSEDTVVAMTIKVSKHLDGKENAKEPAFCCRIKCESTSAGSCFCPTITSGAKVETHQRPTRTTRWSKALVRIRVPMRTSPKGKHLVEARGSGSGLRP